MISSPKFLHSMRDPEYLKQALESGIMFTSHPVEFKPAIAEKDWINLFDSIFPMLERKLAQIGRPWDQLSEERRKVLMMALGSITASVPVICFTEVPESRSLTDHYLQFGLYGLVVRREWLEEHDCDRVVYVGENSPVSRKIHSAISLLQISNLVPSPEFEVCFDNTFTRVQLDLFVHLQTRKHTGEMEWRIAGQHGFLGGGSSAGERLRLPMDQIEAVIVKDDSEIKEFHKILQRLADLQSTKNIPEVIVQPKNLDMLLHAEQIFRLATKFREAIWYTPRLELRTTLGASNFPRGCCDDASLLLAAYLADNGYPDATRVHGVYGGKHQELQSHVWLNYSALWIDITGDQFEDYQLGPVIVTLNSTFHDYFEIESEEPADFRVKFANDPKWLGKFSSDYQRILRNIS